MRKHEDSCKWPVPLAVLLAFAAAGTCPVFAKDSPALTAVEAGQSGNPAAALTEEYRAALPEDYLVDLPEEYPENVPVDYPGDIAEDYAEAEGITDCQASVPGGCGELNDKAEFSGNCMYTISNGTLTITGSGAMGDMNHNPPWVNQRAEITRIEIGEGVEYIGAGAFRSIPGLKTVTIPASVKTIGNHAFEDCSGLEEVYIYAQHVGESAFINCHNLKSVHIGPQVKAIGVSAFENCERITGVYIEDLASWCSIYFGGNNSNPLEQNHAERDVINSTPNRFYLNGREVTDLVIPEGITDIGAFSFYCAEQIRTVTIPDSVRTIGEYAFYRDQQIERVTGAANVTSIGVRAFDGAVSLSQLPPFGKLENVGAFAFRFSPISSFSMESGTIGKGAFYGCSGLLKENVKLGEAVRIGEEAFKTQNKKPEIIASNAADDRQTVKLGSWNGHDIEWLVLGVEDGDAILLSKKVLEFRNFLAYVNPKDAYKAWADSELRTWLNGEFYNKAFSDSDKGNIVSTRLTDDDNPLFGTKGGAPSESKLYILSATELEKYFEKSEDRMAGRISTAYAYTPSSGGVDSLTEDEDLHTSYYWVRTPGITGNMQSYVHYSGRILYDGQDKNNPSAGVRPAMRVKAAAYGIVDEEAVRKEKRAKIETFVARLYRGFLGREPEEAGLKSWADALAAKKITGSKIVRNFIHSQEFTNLNLDDEGYITALYRTIFGREPDQKGLDAWKDVLDRGYSRDKVMEGFVNSDEMKALCDEAGIVYDRYRSTDPVDVNINTTRFVIRLYRLIMGRNADKGGLDTWVTALNSGNLTASEVVNSFFDSVEWKNRNTSDEEFVTAAYLAILDREPDEGGMAAWVGALKRGSERKSVLRGFLGSPEFKNLCDSYGLRV